LLQHGRTKFCDDRSGRILVCSVALSLCCALTAFAQADEDDRGGSTLLDTLDFSDYTKDESPVPATRFQSDLPEHDSLLRDFTKDNVIPDSSDPCTTAPVFHATEPDEVFDGRSPPLSQETVFLDDDPLENLPGAGSVSVITYGPEEIQSLREGEDAKKGVSFRRLSREPYTNYRVDEARWSWLPGSGDDFGWLSFQGSPYEPRGKRTGFGGSFGLHLLGGPTTAPVPPRLYDFVFGMQKRDSLSDRFSYDIAATIGVFSDFEGSAREGVRFPGHAVGMVHINMTTDLVFGVDYLGRDDIAVLPVVGVSLRDRFVSGLSVDLVFPRPRIDYVLSDDWRSYLTAGLDGGTWDIQFPNGTGQVMTYRDYRLMLGFEHADSAAGISAWEFGYAFGRELEFRNNPVSTRFDDAFVLQWVWRR